MTTPISTADSQWLIGPDAGKWLDMVRSEDLPLHKLIAQLRRDLTATRTHLVVEQVELRKKARAKFEAADQMFFTDRGLQQATDQWVAAYKAGRMPCGEPVADLCMGVGGDLCSFAKGRNATGVDRDASVALLAEANLRTVGESSSANVVVADVCDFDVAEFRAWHIDPDRRPKGTRTTRVALHEPAPAVIETLMGRNPNAAIKLAPAAELPVRWEEQAELEWISFGRTCRQLVAWFGELAHLPGERSATVLNNAGKVVAQVERKAEDRTVDCADRAGRFVFEPDAAVLAAGLINTVAAQHGLKRLAPGIAYLTGDEPVDHAALSAFEVLEQSKLDVRRLKQILRSRSIGRIEVKKRGIDVDPLSLQKQLSGDGDVPGVLLITRIADDAVVFVARRWISSL